MTDPGKGFGSFGGGHREGRQQWGNGLDPNAEVQMVPGIIRDISEIPPRPWAYGRFMLFGSAAVIGAVDGAGKGTVAATMVCAFITGQPLLGEKVWRAGKVAIVSYEDDQDEWERRIAAACIHHKLDYKTIIASVRFLIKPGGRVTFAERDENRKLAFPDTPRIVHFLQEAEAVALIIDPFNSAHAMEDGNNNVAIAAVAQEITSIAQQTNVAVLVNHHLRKGGGGTVDDLMGATALRANFRACRILQVMDDGTAIGFQLPADEAFRYLWVSGTKENYAPPPHERMWFHIESIDLNNPAGIYKDGDSVGAIERWAPPAAYQDMTYERMKAVFDALAAQPHARNKQATALPWAAKPLMNAGRSEQQAKKILADWLQNDVLVAGDDDVKGKSRHRIQTVKPNPQKVAEILAALAPAGPTGGPSDA